MYVYISLTICQAADAKVQSGATSQDIAHLRPEGFGYLLDLIKIIMGQSDTSFVPLEKLDAAQFTLLRWGNFIPWAWTTWNDQRIANAECLRSLVCISSGLFSREINCCLQTATWLYHLNAPIFQKPNVALNRKISEVDLHAILHADIFSSSLMISVRFLYLSSNWVPSIFSSSSYYFMSYSKPGFKTVSLGKSHQKFSSRCYGPLFNTWSQTSFNAARRWVLRYLNLAECSLYFHISNLLSRKIPVRLPDV